MKTGWQMEWENEVRYFAPLRAEFNTRAKAMASMVKPMIKFMDQFSMSMRQAAKGMQQLGRALDQSNKT